MEEKQYANYEDEIELKELISILLSKKKFIVRITLIVGLVALLASTVMYFIKPPVKHYMAYTTIEAIASEENPQQVNAYFELAGSVTTSSRVKDRLKLQDEATAINEKTNVEKVSGTNEIRIKYTDASGDSAKEIVDIIAEESVKFANEVMTMDTLEVRENAALSTEMVEIKEPVNIVLNVVIGLILGLMASVFTVFMMNYFNDNVRTVKDIEEKLGVRVLSSIPKHSTK
ncbi:YveK family protein [Alkalibacter mobilis]|uniref:YveK family protein n=1 Tax=Alkalibacter mobilis TaxID=2787712 RepID=UPI00189F13D2|nr:hypothetical protein [Alkalibacter mobilis]